MAAFVGFHLFVPPQIARLSGSPPAPFGACKARAAFSWRHRPGRQEVFPGRCLGTDGTGLPLLERLGNGVSATLFPLSQADGLATVAALSEGVTEGDLIDWQPFGTGGWVDDAIHLRLRQRCKARPRARGSRRSAT